jgi:hypothetical protein
MKASWRGTALRLRIEADDVDWAMKRAETMVKRMEGGYCCLGIECVKQEY